MTTVTDTQRARLERAFETLKKQHITPILILSGSTGVIEENLADYTETARAACTPDSWVGAHVGTREHRGACWDDSGRLVFRYDDSPVEQIWFSFPIARRDIAEALQTALEQNAFYTSHLSYDESGDTIGPGTVFDSVRLVLKEED